MTFVTAGLALLALTGGSLRAEIALEDWKHFESASFRLLSNGENEASTGILLDLERFRRAFTQLAPGIDSSFPVPTRIVAFGDSGSYAPFKSEGDSSNTRILGQFLGHRDGNFITLNLDPRWSGGLGIIIHEYVHHIVNQNLPGVPRWLNEGLAEYYSTCRGDGRFAVIGHPVERHLRWWRRSREVSVLDVVGEARDTPIHSLDSAGQYYAVSWGLTHYLLSKARGADLLANYLEEVASGEDRSESLLSVLGVSGRELEAELRRYIVAETLPTTSLALEDLGEVGITEAVASPGTVLTVLAELAARLGNERHAEELFNLALGHEPESAEALAGLASLRDGQARLEEAGVLFDDALALGPKSARSYLRYGRHLLRRIELEEDSGRAKQLALDAKTSFLTAGALEPSFAETLVMLAFVHLFDGLEAEEGLGFGERARELLPTRVDVVHTLIRLHLKLGSIDRATELLEGSLGVLAKREFQERVRDEIQRAELLLAARAALSDGRWDEGLELFDQAISHTVDAEVRVQMEEQLERLEQEAERAKTGAGSSR
jgi:tetratricopeptide (TPR) repeat protein